MAYIYPLNNPGGVHLTVCDFTHLSAPPTIRKTKFKAYGKSCGRCKQHHHFTFTCKVTQERLPEVLARNGQKYQPPSKEGKAPFKKNKARVNATETDPPNKEATPAESKLSEQVATLQARLDSLLPHPSMACVSAWLPAPGLERDQHANVVSVTLPKKEHQLPLTYSAASKRPWNQRRDNSPTQVKGPQSAGPWEPEGHPSQGTRYQGQTHCKAWYGWGGPGKGITETGTIPSPFPHCQMMKNGP